MTAANANRQRSEHRSALAEAAEIPTHRSHQSWHRRHLVTATSRDHKYGCCSSLSADGWRSITSISQGTQPIAASREDFRVGNILIEKILSGVQAPQSSTSRRNSSKPHVPSGRSNRSTHRSCSIFSMLRKTNQLLSMRLDTGTSCGERSENGIAQLLSQPCSRGGPYASRLSCF